VTDTDPESAGPNQGSNPYSPMTTRNIINCALLAGVLVAVWWWTTSHSASPNDAPKPAATSNAPTGSSDNPAPEPAKGADPLAGLVTLPSGLRYQIENPGTGDHPRATDNVKVNYTGVLMDGTKFDSSADHGGPATFPLNGVIPGWTEGMQLIGKGGKIRLVVPANLAYGDRSTGGIPAGSTLLFEIELLDINP
jgi:FKBP-type peptidyl-prolyl cis-trans isomerase FkpA